MANEENASSTPVANNTVVAIDYTLRSDAGEVIDSSEGRDPLYYLQGHGNIIPGLEKALDGKTEGDELKVRVSPEEGYGVHDESLIADVPRSQFGGIDDIQVGMQFRAQTNAGPRVVRVAKVSDEAITVDGNHPLAGQALNFDVKVRSVRNATQDELAHGHVHGPDGNSGH